MPAPSSTSPANASANGTPAPSAKDRVPTKEVLAYSGGVAVGNQTEHILTYNSHPIFNGLLGVNPAAIGLILAIGRMWDAFADTFMANVSDNHRSRWGRRRPFILFGGLGTGIAFAGIYFFPTGLSANAYFWFLAVSAFVFYTFHTIFIVPHLSLLPELTSSPRERTRISAWSYWLLIAVSAFTLWFLRVSQSSLFPDTFTGLRVVASVVGLITIATAAGIFLTIRERHQERVQHQRRLPFFSSVKATLEVRPLYWLCGAALLATIGGNIANSLGFYMMFAYVQNGQLASTMEYQAYIGTTWIVSTLITVPLATPLANRLGRKKTFIIALVLMAVGSALRWICYIPGHPIWSIVPALLVGPGTTVVQFLTQAMIGDVADFDELRTGARREGMISAVQLWSMKATNSLNYFLGGVVVWLVGYNSTLGGNQSEFTFYWMRAVFGFQPLLFLALAAWAIWKYNLDEETVEANRRELERRRGA